jgi:signal transduction histidine kinase
MLSLPFKSLILLSALSFCAITSLYSQNSNTNNNTSSTQRKELDLYFEKGIASIERTQDSVQFYIRLIDQVQTTDPIKNYYKSALDYSHSYSLENIEETGQSGFAMLKWASKANEACFMADSYECIALYYREISMTDSATYYFELAIKTASAINDVDRVQGILTNYSNLLIKKGKKDEVLTYTMNAIEHDSLYNQKKNQASYYHLLGNIHLYSGDYPNALNAYQIAYNGFESRQQILKMIKVLNNIGLVYSAVDDLEMAKKSYLDVISLATTHQLEKQKISALINLGAVYLELEDFEMNRKMLEEALHLSTKYNSYKFQGSIQNNLGNLAYYEGDYALALEHFSLALAINISRDNKHEQALCLSNKGWAYLMLNNESLCFQSFNEALNLATSIQSPEKRMMALEGLADASEYFGNYKDALSYKNKFVALKDSLLGEKSKNKIAELQTLYESEKKENEIKDLKQEQALSSLTIRENELQISRLNWQRFGLALVIFLMILVAYISWRSIKTKKELEKNQAIISEREKGIQAVFDATEEERQRIAKDLHDGIGQQMSGLKLAWQNLTISSKNLSEEEKNKLHDLSKILDSTAADVRDISHRMMPKVLEAFGLVPAIEEMLEKAFKLSEIKYEFEHYNFDQRLPRRTEIALFRICQELINNVIKHANANFVSIQLFKNQNQLILIVEDNGKGIQDNANQDGHGLLNIKSRLNTINGHVNYEGSQGAGTTATIRILLN